jgi:hypothetical protein
VKCDVCEKEFNKSEELKRDKEQMHRMDESEAPDMDRENPEVKREMPESEPADLPAERITR